MHFHVWVGQYISITEGKMILAALAQFAVCFLILAWVLKKKTGEPYSRKAVIRFVLFGALGVILFFCLTLVLPIQEDTFYGMNPIISGFLTALITASLTEEIMRRSILIALRSFEALMVQSWLI